MQLLCRTADLKPSISCAKCHWENYICTVYYKSEKQKPENKKSITPNHSLHQFIRKEEISCRIENENIL
jgi:hypothetical protein